MTPPEPEKPVEAVPPTAPVEEKKVEPPHPEHEAHEREERNNIHKPHEGLHQSANPIPDNNLIEDVSPDLIGQWCPKPYIVRLIFLSEVIDQVPDIMRFISFFHFFQKNFWNYPVFVFLPSYPVIESENNSFHKQG